MERNKNLIQDFLNKIRIISGKVNLNFTYLSYEEYGDVICELSYQKDIFNSDIKIKIIKRLKITKEDIIELEKIYNLDDLITHCYQDDIKQHFFQIYYFLGHRLNFNKNNNIMKIMEHIANLLGYVTEISRESKDGLIDYNIIIFQNGVNDKFYNVLNIGEHKELKSQLETLKDYFTDKLILSKIDDLVYIPLPLIEPKNNIPLIKYSFNWDNKSLKGIIRGIINSIPIKIPVIIDKGYSFNNFFENEKNTKYINFDNYIELFENKNYYEFKELCKSYKNIYTDYSYMFDYNDKLSDILLNLNKSKKLLFYMILNFYNLIKDKENKGVTRQIENVLKLLDYKFCKNFLTLKKIEFKDFLSNTPTEDDERISNFIEWLAQNKEIHVIEALFDFYLDEKKIITHQSHFIDTLLYNIAIEYIDEYNDEFRYFTRHMHHREYKLKVWVLIAFYENHPDKLLNKLIRKLTDKKRFNELEQFIIDINLLKRSLHKNYKKLDQVIIKDNIDELKIKLKKYKKNNPDSFYDFYSSVYQDIEHILEFCDDFLGNKNNIDLSHPKLLFIDNILKNMN